MISLKNPLYPSLQKRGGVFGICNGVPNIPEIKLLMNFFKLYQLTPCRMLSTLLKISVPL
jgi:hypothetical protein